MAELELPKFWYSSLPDMEKTISSIRNAELKKGNDHDKNHRYFLTICRYRCLIPKWEEMDMFREFGQWYQQELLDLAMMKKINDCKILKWFNHTTMLLPVRVPYDGHSLFHAITTALWGLRDTHQTIPSLMEKAVLNMDQSLFARWQVNNSALKIEERHQIWSGIITKLQGKSSSAVNNIDRVPPVAIFVLANVIHRPIVVIDCTSPGSSTHSSEHADMEGIYLPLERSSSDCFKSPLLLCHNDHHFCPLMFKSVPKNRYVFPLNKGDLSLLPVRFLMDEENAVSVISHYLDVEELHVRSGITLLCSIASVTPLPDHLNSMNAHFQTCKEIYKGLMTTKNISAKGKQQIGVPPNNQIPPTGHPSHYIDESNQTYVVSSAASRRSYGNQSQSLPFSSPAPKPRTPMNLMGFEGPPSDHFSPLEKTKDHESFSVTRLAQVERNQCLTPGCLNGKSDGFGDLCEACFKRTASIENGLELMSVCTRGEYGYVMETPRENNIEREAVACRNDKKGTASEERIVSETYREATSLPFPSAINEPCKQCSHYLCSQNTYPYCHECSRKNRGRHPDNGHIDSHSLQHIQRHASPSNELRGSSDIGQAERLSLGSDEDVIEISEAPSLSCEAIKCASPVCEAMISAREKLCEKCKNILISCSQLEKINDRETRSEKKGENQITISTHHSGTTSNSCFISRASAPLSVKEDRKGHSERIAARQNVNGQEASKVVKKISDDNKNQFTHTHNADKLSRHLDERKETPLPALSPLTSLPPSILLNKDAKASFQEPATKKTSFDKTVDSEFERVYQQLTKEQRKDAGRCRTPNCQNYGNKKKGGYCNGCANNMTHAELHDAIFGPYVCDTL